MLSIFIISLKCSISESFPYLSYPTFTVSTPVCRSHLRRNLLKASQRSFRFNLWQSPSRRSYGSGDVHLKCPLQCRNNFVYNRGEGERTRGSRRSHEPPLAPIRPPPSIEQPTPTPPLPLAVPVSSLSTRHAYLLYAQEFGWVPLSRLG